MMRSQLIRRGSSWERGCVDNADAFEQVAGSKIGAKSVPNWDKNGRARCYCGSGQSSSCCTFSTSE
jgi:hypothetical protein